MTMEFYWKNQRQQLVGIGKPSIQPTTMAAISIDIKQGSYVCPICMQPALDDTPQGIHLGMKGLLKDFEDIYQGPVQLSPEWEIDHQINPEGAQPVYVCPYRLVLDADNAPMVVPFVHAGMQEIMPIGAMFPRVGKTVTILVGDPIDFKDLRDLEQDNNIPRGNLYDAVSARIGDRLIKLKAQVDKLVQPQTDVTLKQDIMVEHFKTGYEQDNQYFRVGFSYEGSGIVSRIRGYMDPTELMGFAARGLFMNQRMKEHIEYVQGVRPLKAWNSFWKHVHQNHGVASTAASISMLAWAT